MKVIFKYTYSKDVENFERSLSGLNNRAHTTFQQAYIKEYGTDFKKENIKKFITEYIKGNNVTIGKKIIEIQSKWLEVENKFFKKSNTIFKTQWNQSITCYLTTNNRCTYNISKGYFFVYLNSSHSNAVIMHELFHFYTWCIFGKMFIKNPDSQKIYNDFKESLTVLLNIEYKKLMDGAIDLGYPQHQLIREFISTAWAKYKDLYKVTEALLKTKISDIGNGNRILSDNNEIGRRNSNRNKRSLS